MTVPDDTERASEGAMEAARDFLVKAGISDIRDPGTEVDLARALDAFTRSRAGEGVEVTFASSFSCPKCHGNLLETRYCHACAHTSPDAGCRKRTQVV